MKPVVKSATPAAIAVLRQATALAPKRKKASDGLLPSKAHIKANPNSDHNTGLAVDLTHDPDKGIDCEVIFQELKKDRRVSYLIFNKKIWSPHKASQGDRAYTGSNPHTKHLHLSIKEEFAKDTSPWFPFLGKAKVKNRVTTALKKKKPKKQDLCTCKTCPVHKED